jgi:hypothetical protein
MRSLENNVYQALVPLLPLQLPPPLLPQAQQVLLRQPLLQVATSRTPAICASLFDENINPDIVLGCICEVHCVVVWVTANSCETKALQLQ